MKRSPSTVPSESSVDRISSALRMRSKSPLRGLRLVRLFAVIVTTPPQAVSRLRVTTALAHPAGPSFALQHCPRKSSRKRANRMPKCRKYVDTEATHNVRPAPIRHANLEELGELASIPAAHARARSTARLISSGQSARAPQKPAVGRLNEDRLAGAAEAGCGVPGGSPWTPRDRGRGTAQPSPCAAAGRRRSGSGRPRRSVN